MVLANLEAIVGQMFVAVFIARLVGLHIVGEAEAGDRTDGAQRPAPWCSPRGSGTISVVRKRARS
jgi:hypothetical protein